MNKTEKLNDEFNVKKSKKKGIIAIIAVVAIVIIALLVYFANCSKPQKIFNMAIDKIFKIKVSDYNSIKLDTKTRVSFESKNKTFNDQYKEIENFSLKFGTQLDRKEKKEITNIGLEYDSKSLADAQVYYDNGNVYAYLYDLFDKYIKMDIEDEYKEQAKTIVDAICSEKNTKNTEKAIEIIGEELKVKLNEYGKFESSKETIKINDKEEKVKKSTLTLSEKDVYSVLSSISLSLSNNEEFLNCFEDSPKDILKEFSESIKNNQTDENGSLKISIYTKGLLNQFKGIKMEVNIGENDETIIATLIKEDKNVYSYSIDSKEGNSKSNILKLRVEIEKEKESKKEEKGKLLIDIEVPDAGKVKFTIDYSLEYNNGIDKIDTKNSINMNELTEDDIQNILQKLQDRPFIGEIMNSYLNMKNNFEYYM